MKQVFFKNGMCLFGIENVFIECVTPTGALVAFDLDNPIPNGKESLFGTSKPIDACVPAPAGRQFGSMVACRKNVTK
jgi:hypothetical protein